MSPDEPEIHWSIPVALPACVGAVLSADLGALKLVISPYEINSAEAFANGLKMLVCALGLFLFGAIVLFTNRPLVRLNRELKNKYGQHAKDTLFHRHKLLFRLFPVDSFLTVFREMANRCPELSDYLRHLDALAKVLCESKTRSVNWRKLKSSELLTVVQDAEYCARDGISFAVTVAPEVGHREKRIKPGNWDDAISGCGHEVEEYVVDSPQTVRVVPAADEARPSATAGRP